MTATTDSSYSTHKIYQPHPPLTIRTESASGVKSLDGIIKLRPKELPVQFPKPRQGLPKTVNESHLQTVLLMAQHVQVLRVTIRKTVSTPASVGSKKEASLEETSSETAA